MADSGQVTRSPSREGAPLSIRARQTELSIRDLYAIVRHLRIKQSGLLGLYHTPNFHELQESDAPQLLKDATDLCRQLHPNSADIQQVLESYRAIVIKHWQSPKPLVKIQGFDRNVYPNWKEETDCRLDHTITSKRPSLMNGFVLPGSNYAVQSVFVVVVSSLAFLRIGDQRCPQDLVSKLSPIAQVAYAIQLASFPRLKEHRPRLSTLLSNQTRRLPMFSNGFRNVHDIFTRVFNGVASFSFHTSRLPFCIGCSKPILQGNQVPKRTAERSIIFVDSQSTSNQAAIQSFFGATKFHIDNTRTIVDLTDPEDEEHPPKRRKIEPGSSNRHVCQTCNRKSQGHDRNILLDRMPYFMALGYDRSGLSDSNPAKSIPSTELPDDWKSTLRLQNMMNLQGNTSDCEYTLTGAIISHGVGQYSTIWRGRTVSEPWLHYNGLPEDGERVILQDTDLPTFVNNPGESIAAILVYKQIRSGT